MVHFVVCHAYIVTLITLIVINIPLFVQMSTLLYGSALYSRIPINKNQPPDLNIRGLISGQNPHGYCFLNCTGVTPYVFLNILLKCSTFS